MGRKRVEVELKCRVCGSTERPAINKNEEFCSELCRKRLVGEIPLRQRDILTMDSSLLPFLREIGQHAYLREETREEIRDGNDRVIKTLRLGPERKEKEGNWVWFDSRPIRHDHPSGLGYPAVNVTDLGDDVEWFECAECGARATGWRLGSEGDE